jgi:hypothetical protein
MSFFGIGKSKKSSNSALPAATRNISSSAGEKSFIPTANGISPGLRDAGDDRAKALPGSNNTSVNNSLNSLSEVVSEKPGRNRSESDVQVRISQFRSQTARMG